MNNLKMVFATIAIVVIGIIALPYAASLFSGEHSWYELSAGGSDVPCEKCHADIADEYQDAFAHPLYAPHKTYPCAHCHRVSGFGEKNGSGMNYASGDGSGSTPGKQAHAAVIVECMDCHDLNYMWGKPPPPPSDHHMNNPQYETCGWGGPPEGGGRNCHALGGGENIKIIRAGGFGLTDFDNMSTYTYWKTWPEDTGSKAAHRAFVLDAIENNTLEGANEACIGCHSKVNLKIRFNVTTEATIVVNNSYSETESHWEVESITASDYKTYEEVKG